MRQPLTRKTAGIENVYPERIVQFGAGNFIRAFADWMIQTLNEQTDFASSVVVVKVTPHGKYDALDAQDGLFHVHTEGIENGEFVSHTQLISCISRTVYPYENFDAYLDLACQPDIRFLISNTTESGIRYDADSRLEDAPTASFPAKLTQFLYARYRHYSGADDKGCVILPTELVVDNGSQLREMILQYADQWRLEADFSGWITKHNTFCNTLVDRIVPGYPEDKSAAIHDAMGYDDRLLVMGEPYHSFVIAAPPSLAEELPTHKTSLNVQFVDDVDPYRQTKVRILNGLHTSMVPLGYLLGLETVRECIDHPQLGQFLRDEAMHDIIPSLSLPQDELAQFAQAVFDRFRNPSVHHRLLSIAVNNSAKVKTRLVPTLLAYHEKIGALPPRVVVAFAAFIYFYKNTELLNDDDSVIAWFAEQWQSRQTTEALANAVLSNTTLWDIDLTQIDGLEAQICADLEAIEQGTLLARVEALNRQTI